MTWSMPSDLRRLYGVSVVAIRRGQALIPNPGGDQVVQATDLLVVLGLGEEIAAATQLVRSAQDLPGPDREAPID